MKTIYTFLFSILLYSGASAQWSVIYNNTVAPIEEFRGCYFTNSLNGIIVGAQTAVGNPAIIRKTTDGGTSWTPISAANTDTLRSVWFTDDTTGFACGAKGRIIRTFDAGLTWDTVSSGVINLLRSVTFPTPQVGYICGGGGVILKSTDSGNTWVQQTDPLTQDLINIRFLNQDTGYACSSLSSFTNGYVIRTYDGGNTWDTVYFNAEGLLGIAIANDTTIVAAGGNQTIVRSTDGGQTWNTVYTGTAGYNFRSGWFATPTRGYMIGDVGSLFKTNDAGATWTSVSVTTTGLLGVHFPVADTGYVAGNGTILKYITPCTPSTPTPINSSATACSLDTAMYCVPAIPGATSYQWTVPAGNTIVSGQGDSCITVAFGNQTSGNITVFAVNGCGNSDTTTLAVTVHVAPTAPTISMVGNQLMSSSPSNIQWSLNGVPIPGATTQYYTPTQNGNYTVTFTNIVGCSSTSAPYVLIDLGMKELSAAGISVYPNPADGVLIVNISENASDLLLKIMDAAGRNVLSRTSTENKSIMLDVSSLENGLYIITAQSQRGISRSNLMIFH